MKILGKSAIKTEDLKGKARLDKYIEIQMLKEFESNNVDINKYYNEIVSIPEIDIIALHVPIISGNNINIEFIGNYMDRCRISNSIILAGKLSKHYNHKIKVVIHTAMKYEIYDKMPVLFENIVNFFEEYFYRYPLLDYCFENVVPLEIGNDFKLRNGCLYDNVKLANRLNFCFSTDRFGTVLDTCHALVTERVFKNMLHDYPELLKNISLENFFKENKETIKLIHLCDVTNLGFVKGTHGIKFEDINLMEQIMDFYKKYNYDCDITIEITEKDYVKNDNFKDNLSSLKKICIDKKIDYNI